MKLNLRYPMITIPKKPVGDIGIPTPVEPIVQIQSYLYQLVDELNVVIDSIDKQSSEAKEIVKSFASSGVEDDKKAQDTFNSIKALIIKSADIVKAYEESFLAKFNGTYFAGSDFGTYLQETSAAIEANSRGVTEVFTNVQTITNDDGTGTLDELMEESRITNAYIKRGLLGYDDNGNAVYGVEVGETTESGAFLKYARFKSDRLSFYDENGAEVAYIGAGCLYVVGKSVFLGEIKLGGYKTDTSDGLAFTWIGG